MSEDKKKDRKERKEKKDEKKEKKKKRESRHREADQLKKDEDNDEIHQHEVKRMRTWSHDETNKYPGTSDNGQQTKRPRTRSMDAAEEKKQDNGLSTSEWRKEQDINVIDYDKNCNTKYDPLISFADVPFCAGILKRIAAAKYEKPSAIQAQVGFLHQFVNIQKFNLLLFYSYRHGQLPFKGGI